MDNMFKDLLKPNHTTHLLSTRIPGTRKGSSEPAYLHSVRVGESLSRHGYPQDVVLGGYLHDIIEDGEATPQELACLGYSARTIALVLLASHDQNVEHRDARWVKMVAALIDMADADAWAIKVADITDNLRGCRLMSPDRPKFLRFVKGPLMRELTEGIVKRALWEELDEVVEEGLKQECL
ncbi:hypothetical protein HYV73_04715 [Candidatus Uhrbacteria bacterium]|nr:hypothetical protein [Candidatus Uhrbacteria bacterium]